MKAIKKACSGTSLYPKSSSVSSKLKTGGKIKKAQDGKSVLKYSDPKPLLEKIQKTRDSINLVDRKVKDKKASEQSAWKSKWNKASSDFSKKKNTSKVTKAKDGKWIQKAVNPAHKGYCTPMTKATCTPKRKALAKTFKKMAKERKGK